MTDINVPPRAFKVGDEVVCLNRGIGEVVSVDDEASDLLYFPVRVLFKKNYQSYKRNGKLHSDYQRCLFHADENVKVTVTEAVYKYQVSYKRKEFARFEISDSHYQTVEEFKDHLNQYESIELFLPSKRLV